MRRMILYRPVLLFSVEVRDLLVACAPIANLNGESTGPSELDPLSFPAAIDLAKVDLGIPVSKE